MRRGVVAAFRYLDIGLPHAAEGQWLGHVGPARHTRGLRSSQREWLGQYAPVNAERCEFRHRLRLRTWWTLMRESSARLIRQYDLNETRRYARPLHY
jgi:hypothetical protein